MRVMKSDACAAINGMMMINDSANKSTKEIRMKMLAIMRLKPRRSSQSATGSRK